MNMFKTAFLALSLVAAPAAALAQETAPAAPAEAAAAPAVLEAATNAAEAAPAFPAAKPVPGIGQPVDGALGIQPQVTKIGEEALWMHDWLLMPIMVAMSVLVLFLLFWVAARYRAKANPVASKTSHHTLIEVIWTLVPVLILVGIAIPSISLLAKQFKPAPEGAITLKAIGNQWNWSYEYPDHGIEFTANMLTDEQAKAAGEPRLLGVDNRIVLPVGVPVKLLTTASDVIHSWAVPAFWIKLDAVPGRTNETSFTIEKPGVYYGQCSELCGDRHAFMPIAVEAVSPEQFQAWVKSKGGKMPAEKAAEEAAAKAAADAANAANAAAAANAANAAAPANATEAAPAAANATNAAAAATGN
ncbi:cytochrome c oxidase subunit II [Sphingomonas cavernae]|uniref:Cytochrome c oxidase subunit 2 n=1 Tax=Sphingomonas cavernae TaxID=2320861 RepID=A0A418WSK4_9SPHN|nr:cytochrome c oxidase subunit II [Sphingomonas cavernae]RJF94234.1 cytochrome c oxidase subunit II [Sphingomonas cavernae]